MCAKFVCKELSMSINGYTGPSGTRYQFMKNPPTEVNIPQDIEFFKSNKRFEEVGFVEEIKDGIKEIVKRGRPKKE